MNCDRTRDWLLQAEHPHELDCAPTEVLDHLHHCAECQRLVTRLQRLEQAYSDLPLPAGAEQACAAFLDRIADPPPLPVSHGQKVRRSWRPLRWLAAACLLFALAGALLFWPSPQVHAAELVERLVDWNLELAQAQPRAERDRIYAGRHESVTDELRRARLAPADRQLAEALVENASWLSQHDDPVEAAERFNAVADHLLERLQSAAAHNDRQLAGKMAGHYSRITELGLTACLERAQASPALDFEHQRKLEKVILRDASRLQALNDLLEVTPSASRKEIKRVLGVGGKQKSKPARPGKAAEPEKATSQK